jgi:hypothetical protein
MVIMLTLLPPSVPPPSDGIIDLREVYGIRIRLNGDGVEAFSERPAKIV